jgi:hypothetical protein
MNDFSGLDALNRVHESRKERAVIFHPVPLYMDNHDSESQLLEIVFMLETLVDGNQNVTLALSLRNELRVGQRSPLSFGNGQDCMIGESLTETRIDAFV